LANLAFSCPSFFLPAFFFFSSCCFFFNIRNPILALLPSLFLAFSASFSALLFLALSTGFLGRLGLVNIGASAALLCLFLTPFPPFFLCGGFTSGGGVGTGPLSSWWCSGLLANLAFSCPSFFLPAFFFFSSCCFFFNIRNPILALLPSLFLAFSASFSALLFLALSTGFLGRLGLVNIGASAALLCLFFTPFPPFFLCGGFTSGGGVGTGPLSSWWCSGRLANLAFSCSSIFLPAFFFFSSSCFLFNIRNVPLDFLPSLFLAFSASFSALVFLASFTVFFFLPSFTGATGGRECVSWFSSSSSADL